MKLSLSSILKYFLSIFKNSIGWFYGKGPKRVCLVSSLFIPLAILPSLYYLYPKNISPYQTFFESVVFFLVVTIIWGMTASYFVLKSTTQYDLLHKKPWHKRLLYLFTLIGFCILAYGFFSLETTNTYQAYRHLEYEKAGTCSMVLPRDKVDCKNRQNAIIRKSGTFLVTKAVRDDMIERCTLILQKQIRPGKLLAYEFNLAVTEEAIFPLGLCKNINKEEKVLLQYEVCEVSGNSFSTSGNFSKIGSASLGLCLTKFELRI